MKGAFIVKFILIWVSTLEKDGKPDILNLYGKLFIVSGEKSK